MLPCRGQERLTRYDWTTLKCFLYNKLGHFRQFFRKWASIAYWHVQDHDQGHGKISVKLGKDVSQRLRATCGDADNNDVNVPRAYDARYYARSIPGATTLTLPAADAPGVSRDTVHDLVAADAVKFFLTSLN